MVFKLCEQVVRTRYLIDVGVNCHVVFQLCERVVRTRYLIDVGVELSCGV